MLHDPSYQSYQITHQKVLARRIPVLPSGVARAVNVHVKSAGDTCSLLSHRVIQVANNTPKLSVGIQTLHKFVYPTTKKQPQIFYAHFTIVKCA
jgi:hypothetical protein